MFAAMSDPRYPIGKFQDSGVRTAARREELFAQLAAIPLALRDALAGLGEAQLDTPYRAGGWTLRQVTHHLADSSLHGYVRTKFVVAEDRPTVKPYDEDVWAAFADATRAPVATSLDLISGLTARWVMFLRGLPAAAFERRYVHPESGEHDLGRAVELYVWHGRHHVGHIATWRSAAKV